MQIPKEVKEVGWEIVVSGLEDFKRQKSPVMLNAITELIRVLNDK